MKGLLKTLLNWLLQRTPSGQHPGRIQLTLPDDQLAEAVKQMTSYPWMGGKKGAANLIHAEAAWVGAGSYDKIGGALASLVNEEVQGRRQGTRTPQPFEPPVATALGEVWGSDLFELMAWDQRFHICDILDVFNQEYLALQATVYAANSDFVAATFELACQAQGGKAPTVCTKTDRGSQFAGVFSTALKGRTQHVRIPPGSPWFNGESERGHRDCRALLYSVLSTMPRPAKGAELDTLQEACDRVRRLLNEAISKPSLGNVTPREVRLGLVERVQERNRRYVEHQRAARLKRTEPETRTLADRLRGLLDLNKWSTKELLRFLQLRSRDYTAMAR